MGLIELAVDHLNSFPPVLLTSLSSVLLSLGLLELTVDHLALGVNTLQQNQTRMSQQILFYYSCLAKYSAWPVNAEMGLLTQCSSQEKELKLEKYDPKTIKLI